MPSLVTINLGYECNSHCLMCVLPGPGAPSFSAEELNEFIEETSLKTGDCLELSGGEPTLHTDFIGLCRHAAECTDAEVWLVSNGRRFKDREFAKAFAGTGCRGALIALHSSRHSIHDAITQVAGSFHETLAGLEYLQEFGVPLIIRFTAMLQNCDDATDFIAMISKRFSDQRVLFSGICYLGMAKQRLELIGIRYSEVKKHLQPAMDRALEEDILAGLHLMPVCVFDPKYWKYFDGRWPKEDAAVNYWALIKLAKEENEFGYPPACDGCGLKAQCKWEWEIYARRYGLSELQANKSPA